MYFRKGSKTKETCPKDTEASSKGAPSWQILNSWAIKINNARKGLHHNELKTVTRNPWVHTDNETKLERRRGEGQVLLYRRISWQANKCRKNRNRKSPLFP